MKNEHQKSGGTAFDCIIRGGTVVDGTGAPPRRADVGVVAGTIRAVGDLSDASSARVIGAEGMLVCPGFVDIHSHADLSVHMDEHEDILTPMLMQGITTTIGGNCGLGAAPVTKEHRRDIVAYNEAFVMRSMEERITWSSTGDFLDKMKQRGVTLNLGMLAPHGVLRLSVMGSDRRLAGADEVKGMGRLLDRCMEEGAFGMSTGLQYFPGSQSDTDELVSLGDVIKRHEGVFTSHLRSYCHTLPQAIDEVLTVGRKNDIHIQISHIYWQPYSKALTPVVKGFVTFGSFIYNKLRVPIPIELGLKGQFAPIDRAISDGMSVGLDIVPSSQGFTELLAFFPPWVVEGGRDKALERLVDPTIRRKIRRDIEHGEPDWPHRDAAGWSMNYFKMTGWGGVRVMSVGSEKNRHMEGMSFPELGKLVKKHPFEVMCDLLVDEEGRVMVFHTPTVPDDPFVARSMYYALFHPHVSIATDTILLGMGRPSHLFYDCFPRYLSFYAKNQGRISIPEAVRKCTSLPAQQMGITGRGEIREGFGADVVVMNWERLETTATFYEPKRHPTGIEYVIVNGKVVVDGGVYQKGVMAGHILRKS
ncbi:MAG: amidohydrolase family protein [Deltaproteobacteria bacterium]|nr:amidohydrolase family protein [Candidatus Zymogenaceae bacterium]